MFNKYKQCAQWHLGFQTELEREIQLSLWVTFTLWGGKILCRGLRHSICNHFNGQMPCGQEVVAGLTNSTGLVLCGGESPAQQIWPYGAQSEDTLLYFHSIGDGVLGQGISGNQALKHATIFRLFDLTLKDSFNKTQITEGGGGGALGGGCSCKCLATRKGILGALKPTDNQAQQTHYIRRCVLYACLRYRCRGSEAAPGG